MANEKTLSHLKLIREDLITEELMTGRESKCGLWGNPEMFPRKPFPYKCETYFCPVCGYENVDLIKRRVSYFTNDFMRDGGNLYLITLTIPHDKYIDLNDLYSLYSQSLERFKNSSVWRNTLKKELKCHFHFNRYEMKISPKSGYHLHLHITIGGYNLLDTNHWKELLTDLWRRCCKKSGVKRLPTITNGVDIRYTSNGTYSVGKEKKEMDEFDNEWVRKQYNKSPLPKVKKVRKKNIKIQVCEKDIPKKQDSYTPEDLQKILTGYKRIDHFIHPDFSLKELKKYLLKYKKVMSGKKYMKIYFDDYDYKWKWKEHRTTIDDFLI